MEVTAGLFFFCIHSGAILHVLITKTLSTRMRKEFEGYLFQFSHLSDVETQWKVKRMASKITQEFWTELGLESRSPK